MCGTTNIAALGSVTIDTEKLFVDEDTILDLLAPAKAAPGVDGASYSDNGENGSPGVEGPNLIINVDPSGGFMRLSRKSLTVYARGGDGGDGGNGHVGQKGDDGEPGQPGVNGTIGSTGMLG